MRALLLLFCLSLSSYACTGERENLDNNASFLDTSKEQDSSTGTDTKDPPDSNTSGDGGTDSADVPPDIPREELCDNLPTFTDFDPDRDLRTFATVLCLSAERCGNPDPAFLGATELSVDACITQYMRFFTLGESQLVSMEKGTTLFSGEGLGNCMQELCTASCQALSDEGFCEGSEIFRGTVQFGETCYNNDECAGEGRCNVSERGICPGECVSRDACGDFPFCPSNSYCDRSDNDPSQWTCAPRVNEGEVCRDAHGSCKDGLFCEYSPDLDNYTCIPRRNEGEPCQGYDHCIESLRCMHDETTGEGICGPKGTEGAPCFDDDECATGFDCNRPQGSNDEGTCGSKRFNLESGADCRPQFDTCAWPGVCLSGVCEPLRAAGDACTSPFQCAGWCDGSTCQPHRAAGEGCESDLECSYVCTPDGLCTDGPIEVGQACKDSEDCASRVCLREDGQNHGTCIGACIRP